MMLCVVIAPSLPCSETPTADLNDPAVTGAAAIVQESESALVRVTLPIRSLDGQGVAGSLASGGLTRRD